MAFNKTKIDSHLGEHVHQHLLSLDLETPTTDLVYVDNKEKIAQIEGHMTEIYKIIGMDLTNDSLMETPKRIAKMMVLEENWGLMPDNFPKMTTIENKMRVDEMITVGDISVSSKCEHHRPTNTWNCTSFIYTQ